MEAVTPPSDIYNLSTFTPTPLRNGPPSPIYPGVRRSRHVVASASDSPISPSVGFFRQRTETVSSTCSRRPRERDGSSSPSPPPRFTTSDSDRTRRRRKHKRSATLSPTGRMRSKESRDSWSTTKRENDLLLNATPRNTSRPYERRLSVRSISPTCVNLGGTSGFASIKKRPELPSCVRLGEKRGKLRKTFSEPSEIFVDQCDTQKVERIQDILSSLNFRKFQTSNSYIMPSSSYSLVNSTSGSFITGRSSPNQSATCLDQEIWSTPHGSFLLLSKDGEKPKVLHRNASGRTIVLDDSESDIIATDIEELKEAAQSIELLSRKSRRNPATPPSIDPMASVDSSVCCAQSAGLMMNAASSVPPIKIPANGSAACSSAPTSATLPRRSGITTRLGGHPRGVMQFLPSVRSSEFLSKTAYETYIANKTRREQLSTQSGTEESDTCSPPATVHIRQSSADIYDMQSYMRKQNTPIYQQGAALKRKTSVPDQFYSIGGEDRLNDELDLSMFDSDSTEPSGLTMPTLPMHTPIQQIKTFSDEEWMSNSIASTQTLLTPQSLSYKHSKPGRRTRKVSAPMMDDRLSRLGRFASFAATGMRPTDRANSTSRGLTGSSRKLSRQYSTHASSDTETNTQSVFPIKGSESLVGFSRFGRLLRSLRASRQNSPETDNALSPASSESPLSSPSAHERYNRSDSTMGVPVPTLNMSRSWHDRPLPHKALSHCVTSDSDSSMLQADIMLWRKRSRGSLRKHDTTLDLLDIPQDMSSSSPSPIRLRRKFSLNNAFSSDKSNDLPMNDNNQLPVVSPATPLTPTGSRTRTRRSSSKSALFRFFTVPEDNTSPIDVDDAPSSPSPSTMSPKSDKISKKTRLLNSNRHSFCTIPSTSFERTSALEWSPVDTRTHIVKELFDTESSYIENLQLMVHKYLRPLKRPELCSLVDSSLVDEIFFQIPEILGHHELFFAALKSRLDNWDTRQKIGDIILNNFTKQSVIDTYTAFINNWKHAKRAIRTASQTKPAFAKYLERCSREHRSKLTLDALLIMPVQRIPRYELLIKELLKHTSVEHPDHPVLVRSQKEIHDLAIKINHVEQEAGLSEQMQQRLREIEAIVDGLDDLVSPERIFFRYDLVHVEGAGGKKERCLFLFSDQLIITNVKRKSSNALRKNTVNGPPAHNFLENHKFKLLMKISMDDLEITKHALPALTKIQDDVSNLSEDLRVLGKITELTSLLKVNRESVETEIDQLKDGIRERLTEKHQEMTTNPLLTIMELLVTTEDGIEAFNVSFPNAERRVAWEKCFNDAKETLSRHLLKFHHKCSENIRLILALSLSKRPPPIFLKPLSIQRTRAGLHFTCTSATLGLNEHGYPDLWVCNSDGYIGQVGVLSLTPEPDLSSCIGIANSKILCICSVQVSKPCARKLHKIGGRLSAEEVPSGSNLELNSESSDNDDSTDATETKSSFNGSPVSHKSSSPATSNSTSKAINIKKDVIEEAVPTMWLGTEDGSIQIYNYNDNVRTRKNKAKVQHPSCINSLVNVDDKIFAALGGGELIYYERLEDGTWAMETPIPVSLDVPVLSPITSLMLVTGRLWCALQNYILILNPNTLQLEHSFLSTNDCDCTASCMATGGLGVWLAVKGSSLLKLFHALTYECLLELNLSPTVTKALAGCDDIIRQHKLSCLRITTLLCCKDLLWAGTSAGVIIQLPLPHLAHNSQRLSATPAITVSPVGHSGPCRFLSSVDLNTSLLSRSGSHVGGPGASNAQWDLSKRRMSLNVAALQQGKVYVISGGDGFEDLQDNNTDDADDSIGKEDSTNYLLIWQV